MDNELVFFVEDDYMDCYLSFKKWSLILDFDFGFSLDKDFDWVIEV